MVSLGRPLGRVVRPLLLQRTTVSRQEHSAGHLSTGEQLFSSLPDRDERTDVNEHQPVTCRRLKIRLLRLTIFTGKVLDSYILDRYLLQKVGALAARITSDDAFTPQPIAKPSQVTVTVERIGQKVAGEQREGAKGHRGCFLWPLYWDTGTCVCVSYKYFTYSVDRECNVSKAPGFMEVIWLS